MGLNFTYEPGQTPLDPDETEGMKLPTISTQTELDQAEQLNNQLAVEWTLKKKFNADKLLQEQFVCDLHRKMYGDVWKWAGEFRRTNKISGLIKIKLQSNYGHYWTMQNIGWKTKLIRLLNLRYGLNTAL